MIFEDIKTYLKSGKCYGFNFFMKSNKESKSNSEHNDYLDILFEENPNKVSIPLEYPKGRLLLTFLFSFSGISFYYEFDNKLSPLKKLNDCLESEMIEYKKGIFYVEECKDNKEYQTILCDVLYYIDRFFDKDPDYVYDITYVDIPEDDADFEIENIIKDNLFINIALRKGHVSLKDEDHIQEFNVAGIDGVVYLWQEHASFGKKIYRLFITPYQLCAESFSCFGYELINVEHINELDEYIDPIEFRIEYNETFDYFYVPRNSEEYFAMSYDKMIGQLIGENDDDNDDSQEEITNPKDQFELALRYYYGDGIEKDDEKAVYWFSESAEQEYREAQYSMGVCYMEGIGGLSVSMQNAFQWWLKAAEQGHMEAEYNIGLCFREGIGTLKDPYEARDWFKKAAVHGHEKAKKILGW